MATEAEHLITVSLGKFASSRNQRGGINLHKNLLVANVLFKARAVFVMEKYSKLQSEQSEEYKPASETNSCVTEQDKNLTDNSVERPDVVDCRNEPNIVDNSQNSTKCSDYDSNSDENVCKSSASLSQSRDSDSNEQNCDIAFKQNETAEREHTTNLTSLDAPKCTSSAVKRKHSQNEEDEVFTQTNCEVTLPVLPEVIECSSPTKIARYDYDYTSAGNCTTTFTDSSTNTEPMQTDNTQITELANSFSLSFTGLLKANRIENTCSSKEGGQSTYSNTGYSSSTSSSTESLISCSTQIKEALETLTLPIIALHAC